jgi:polysaccharide deacetylase 2 family uncharacterized protein YibQ
VDATPNDLKSMPGAKLGLPQRRRRGGRAWQAVGLASVLVALAGFGAFVFADRHEPFADAPIRIREAATPAATPVSEQAGKSGPAGPMASGKLSPSPDPRLIEQTRDGLLPRIGADGSRPAQVYARPSAPVSGPKVAILVTGLGISQSATMEAIARLPAPVSLAFGPYGVGLEKTVAEARDKGHEVMLQVPMEPFDYPDNDPGPHTLLSRAPLQENLKRLHWVMGRFTGYTGIVNAMGSKLTADAGALSPILAEIVGRGLLFLDDGSSARSAVRRTYEQVERADLVLDATPRLDAIDGAFARLETLARQSGFAIATVSASPASIDMIVAWAGSLEAKGIRLVPVSSAYRGSARP